ncbi:Ig-like domain-containing protein [Polaribacter aquimarinus]|uniref:Glycosyl hydrolase family 16 n=1 Tax=Polaribacter aquimarinus TaxID=2100726 RepID=A0A2U2J9G9_9FLAO|nr:Ig-like domain-containing protein [Polaribacter aquimarinus]PWG04962.1 glycosyl hydrolase family 16 [Polaribacter aquimarinus]
MKTIKYIYSKIIFCLGLILVTVTSCDREVSDEAVLATFSSVGDVFIDSPVGLGSDFYFPYGGSKPTAWSVDEKESYEGTASMRFDVPNGNDPNGNYAGAIFRIDGAGRDLRKYDALTFWAKASQGVTIGELGFGEDFLDNKYVTSIQNTSLSTSWQKIIIPIPDPSKLIQERGLFRYSAGTQGTNGSGYTFWIDEMKFEKLGTIAQPRPQILNGSEKSEQTFIGGVITLDGLNQVFNLGDGTEQTVATAPAYFNFTSSNPSVATVDEKGKITVSGTGKAEITAKLNGIDAKGKYSLESLGAFTPAPTPTQSAANVISVFSDTYTNIAVDHYNGYWGGSTTQGQNDININGNEIINYKALNYVGVEFHINVPTVNASSMTNFHIDIQVQEDINPGDFIRIGLQDIGGDDTFGGGDDSSGSITIPGTNLTRGSWVSFDFKLSDFTGLTNKSNLGQIVLVSDATIQDVLVDNMYFYEIPTAPSIASPVPSNPSADVISLFSDAYTDVAVDTWRTDWSFGATVLQDVVIVNDNMKEYNNLGFVGVEFKDANTIDATSMTHFRVDTWSATYTEFKIKLVDAGPDGDITTSGDNVEHEITVNNPAQNQWVSHDIPLSSFTGLTKRDKLAQIIFVGIPYGQTKVYVDNVYFRK